MRRLALMKNINMTSVTRITRVGFPFPQIADRSLTVGVRVGSYASKPMALDIARFRSWRSPV